MGFGGSDVSTCMFCGGGPLVVVVAVCYRLALGLLSEGWLCVIEGLQMLCHWYDLMFGMKAVVCGGMFEEGVGCMGRRLVGPLVV